MEATYRNLIVTDWVLIIYILVCVMLIAAKRISNYKFVNFSFLIFSDTYIKTYRDDSLFRTFHFFISGVSLLIFPLLVQVLLFKFGRYNKISFYDYIIFVLFFSGFYMLKMLVQLVFAKIVSLKKVISSYLFQKQTYFSYLNFISLIPLLFFVFTPYVSNFWLYLFVILWVAMFFLSGLLILSRFKELFLSQLLYFILYLCTFEISPVAGVIYYIARL